jgi:hypothetical protein
VQGVKRNLDRFPPDFLFQLTPEEAAGLRSQNVISSSRGGRRYPPYAFTEHGVAMLSSVLKSKRAAQVNIQIVRVFVQYRRMIASHEDLARKLVALERKYDKRFKTVFDALRLLMEKHVESPPAIGYHTIERPVKSKAKSKSRRTPSRRRK